MVRSLKVRVGDQNLRFGIGAFRLRVPDYSPYNWDYSRMRLMKGEPKGVV